MMSLQMTVSDVNLPTLKNPELIKGIHNEYIEAGAKAILTNTFSTGIDAFSGDKRAAKR